MIIDQLFEDDSKKNLNEVDPRNFDSDEDYYAALNAPQKPRYHGKQSPGVIPDDEDYFREIFRKKREAAKKAEQDKQQGVAEGEQLDELSWKDIQSGAKKVSKGAQKFTKNVADTGAAVGAAAKDVGGAIKQVGKTAIADPVSAAYNATKSGLNKAANVAANTYGDVKAGAQKVGQAGATVGTDLGNAAKAVGRGAANVAGGTAGALGATVGGATTGLGRAAAHGFNAGVQNVGGDAVDRLQTNVMARKPADIQKDIEAKQGEIKNLEAELEKVSIPQYNRVGSMSGSVDLATGQPYSYDDLEDMRRAKINTAQAVDAMNKMKRTGQELATDPALGGMLPRATTSVTPTATAAPGAPSSVSYGKGFKTAEPVKPAAPSFAKTGFSGYKAATPAPQMPSAPAAPKAPKVTTGGPTPAERQAYDKRVAAAAAAQPVAETVKQVKSMMETVTTRADVQRIKDYLDQHLGSNLTESARKQRNALLSEVTQLAAVRRRNLARQLAQ